MENIAPPLKLLWTVKKSLEKGTGTKYGIKDYLNNAPKDDWQPDVELWFTRLQQGHSIVIIKQMQSSLIRQQILQILERGIRGEPIINLIQQIEEEVQFQIELEFQRKMNKLPFLMLIPLALLFFPACAILLIGPLVLNFIGSF